MKLILASLLVTLTLAQAPFTHNTGCADYKAALFQYGDAFSAYSANNSARYYSQAPAGESLGQCNVIPCIGSPVFLIEKAHTYMNQQFDL